MKTLTLFIVLFGAMALGASNQIPNQVTNAFKKIYKNIKNVSWEMEDDDHIASFDHDGFSKEAIFTSKGSWVSTISSLSTDDLMDCITDFIDEEYFDAEIIYAEFMETPSYERYNLTILEEEIEYDDEEETEGEGGNGNEYLRLVFDSDCEFISEE